MATNGEFLKTRCRNWGKRLAPLTVLSSTSGELLSSVKNTSHLLPFDRRNSHCNASILLQQLLAASLLRAFDWYKLLFERSEEASCELEVGYVAELIHDERS